MAVYLGIDTSNYTTSAAAFDDVSGCVFQKKMLLPVKSGERGLRQSDAVFHHTQQLWQVVSAVIDECGKPDFIGASYAPRDAEGSYMPCFTVGLNTAKCLSSALNVPLYEFSHQAGHVAAAVYSSGHIELFDREFIAFHVSGGTTEALLVRPDEEKLLNIDIIGRTLDLNAGQAVDRVGVAMGLKFPAGAELEKLALESRKIFKLKPCVKGTDCCLSGIENKCLDMIKTARSSAISRSIASIPWRRLSKNDEEYTRKIRQPTACLCGRRDVQFNNTPKIYKGVRRILCRACILGG